jgi:hypothetical protein
MYLLSSDARNKHYSLGDLIGCTEPAERTLLEPLSSRVTFRMRYASK